MRSGSITFRVVMTAVLLLAVPFAALADTIRLKNGSIIKGRIVGFRAGRFTISIGEGARLKQLTFTADEVESITFDPPSEQPQVSTPVRPNQNVINSTSTASQPPKVIVTGNTDSPTVSPASRPVPEPTRSTGTSRATAAPIAWNIKVLADNTANGWTNSGWVVKKGQRIRVSAEGTVSLGKGNTSPAAGLGELEDAQKLMKNVPTGALIGVIGDDNNDFIYIGSEREFTASRDGALFLGINEGYLDDNSGAFNVKVEILPDGGR